MGSARDAAIEYFRCMREADADGIERLFAPDAFLSICDGTFRRGAREIRDFYETTAMPGLRRPNPQKPIEDGNRCVVEIIIRRRDDDVWRVVDVFTVNDEGRVVSLRVYKGELLDDDPPYDEDPPFPP